MNLRILGQPKTLPRSGHSPLGFAVRIAFALGCGILAAAKDAAWAITLDGTSGTETSSDALSTTGNLQIDLGFFAEYLIVGGGGAGGVTATSGGGGGAGGLLTGSTALGASSHSVTVGGGGTSLANSTNGYFVTGGSGQNSTFADLIAVGGGGGGQAQGAGRNGGSGGGGGAWASSSSTIALGGNGTLGQGNNGGSGYFLGTNAATEGAGGGGGAGAVGTNGSSGTGGAGGAGIQSSITGSPVWYAGGGGGSSRGATQGAGGSGIGGAGRKGNVDGAAGATSTGSGGGGVGGISQSGSRTGGAGGSGIVIVRYAGSPAGTGGSVTPGTGTATGYTLHTFTTTGSTTVTTALDLSGLNLNNRLGLTLTEGITGAGNLTFDGPGRLTLAGANTYAGDTFVNAGTLALGSGGALVSAAIDVASGARFDVSALAGAFTVGSGQELRGAGTILGSLLFGADSKLAFSSSLSVDSGTVLFSGFGIDDIVGLDGTLVNEGTYTLLGGDASFDLSGALNVGFDERADIGGGKEAYFNQGSLQVIVVPEPQAVVLVGVGIVAAAWMGRRRRTPREAIRSAEVRMPACRLA